jgi:hypothetical protein
MCIEKMTFSQALGGPFLLRQHWAGADLPRLPTENGSQKKVKRRRIPTLNFKTTTQP